MSFLADCQRSSWPIADPAVCCRRCGRGRFSTAGINQWSGTRYFAMISTPPAGSWIQSLVFGAIWALEMEKERGLWWCRGWGALTRFLRSWLQAPAVPLALAWEGTGHRGSCSNEGPSVRAPPPSAPFTSALRYVDPRSNPTVSRGRRTYYSLWSIRIQRGKFRCIGPIDLSVVVLIDRELFPWWCPC